MQKMKSLCVALVFVFAVSTVLTVIGMQDAKANSLAELAKRIESLEAKSGGGNVTAGKINKLKIGFSIRHRFELRDNSLGNKAAATSDFTLQRTRIFLDANVNKNVRGFIMLQDVRTWGAEQGTAGNLARVDLQEGYVDLRNLGDLWSPLKNISVRLGRWQNWYGNHRLIGHLNWANQARSYDGARVRYDNKKNLRVDFFAFTISEDQTGGVAGEGSGFNGINGATLGRPQSSAGTPVTHRDELLWGMYSQFKPMKGLVVEPYFFIRSRSRDANATNGSYRTATAISGEERYTAGARVAGKKIAGLPGVDFTLEQVWQFGNVGIGTTGASVTNRSQQIDAFAGAWGAGYTFNMAWKPRIGYSYVFASGDSRSASTSDAETFSQIYPTGHAQLGYMDFHGWQNIRAHKLEFSAKPSKKLLLKFDYWNFQADEDRDGWYNVGGGAGTRVAPDVAGRYDDEYGDEIDVTVKYKMFKNFGVVIGYSHYFVDDAIENVVTSSGANPSRDDDTDWFYFMTAMKF